MREIIEELMKAYCRGIMDNYHNGQYTTVIRQIEVYDERVCNYITVRIGYSMIVNGKKNNGKSVYHASTRINQDSYLYTHLLGYFNAYQDKPLIIDNLNLR